MDSAAFIAVCIPLFVLSIASAAGSSLIIFRQIPCSFTDCIRLAVLLQLLIGLLQVFWLVLNISATYGVRKRLPETQPNSIYVKLLKPIGGEAFRALIIAASNVLISSSESFDIFKAYTIGAIYAANFSIAYCVTFSPFHYTTRYAKFIHQHSIYVSSKHINRAPNTGSDPEISPCLISEDDFSIDKPVFNIESFSQPESTSHSKVPAVCKTQQQFHLDWIDQLYSVSPKNSVYLQTEVESPENERVSLNDILFKRPSLSGPPLIQSCLDIHAMHIHTSEISKPEEFSGNSSSERSSLLSSSADKWNKHYFRQKTINVLIWFRWLIPINCGQNEGLNVNLTPTEVRRSLHKKFSTYTLNSETSSLKAPVDQTLYGTIDLEIHRPQGRETKNIHEFYSFATFANKYFDSALTNTGTGVPEVDHSFLMFGELMTNLPTFYFCLYGVSNILRHFAYTLMLSLIFLSPNPSARHMSLLVLMIILKLFSYNYLRQQSTLSYRYTIAIEFCIMLILSLVVSLSCLNLLLE